MLRAKFYDFYTLEVDQFVQKGEAWQALAEAEKWKTLALQWLTHPQAEPTDAPLNLQIRVNHLTNATTAILYWHLSPAQITTFLLRHDQDPQTFSIPCDPPYDPATKTQTNFTEWLKQYKELYEAQRKGKDTDATQWADQLPQLLTDLAKILKIADICKELQGIQNLILIPHRDLHLLPLHALFQGSADPETSPLTPLGKGGKDAEGAGQAEVSLPKGDLEGFRITYLPQLTPIPHTQNPTPQSPRLLALRNPKSTIATGPLPWAETEITCIASRYDQPEILNNETTLTQIQAALQQPHHLLHFSGHGNSDPENPLDSCLYLHGEDRLTVRDLLKLDLPPYALVSLAACETALSGTGEFINEYVGLPSAFLKSGTRQVLSSQWPVESFVTLLTMVEFYRRYRAGLGAAQALAEVQRWLRELTHAERLAWVETAQTEWPEERRQWRKQLLALQAQADAPEQRPYANPYYWAAFIVTGL